MASTSLREDISRVRRLADYYRNVSPQTDGRYLKDVLARVPREQLRAAVDGREPISQLDSYFLHEAQDFLKVGLVHLQGYKYLMGGGYRAWAYVTLYYSYFHAANCMLRLAGKAIVHVTWPEDRLKQDAKAERVDLILERSTRGREYQFKGLRGNEHTTMFNMFVQAFPSLIASEHVASILEERVQENYELRFPSQDGRDHALNEADTMYSHDFANPEYGSGWSYGAQEYLGDWFASSGYKVAASAEWLRACIEALTEIGRVSDYRPLYAQYFEMLKTELGNLKTKESLGALIQSWLQQGVDRLG